MVNSAESSSILISTFSAALLTAGVMTTTPVGVALSRILQPEAAQASAFDLAHGTPAVEVAADMLANIRVESSTGEKIGKSTAPALDAQGRVVSIGVAMGSGLFGADTVVKKMDAADLIYLHSRRTLVSRLTKSEITALPVNKGSRTL